MPNFSYRVPAVAGGVTTNIIFLFGIFVIIMGQLFALGRISLSEIECPHDCYGSGITQRFQDHNYR